MSLNRVEQQHLTRQAKLLQYANTKRIAGDFNDVTIEVGSESISANRMVLACYSKFFESMFLSPLKERYQNTVVIKDFEGKAVKNVIDYIYSGKISLKTSNVLTLLRTADFLQVDDVKKICFDFLETSLSIENCLDVVKASTMYNNLAPRKQTYQYISDNFEDIVGGNTFKELSKDDVTSLFANVDPHKVQEFSLFEAAINWVKHDKTRETEFSSLFLALNLQNLPSDFVVERVAAEPLVTNSKECLSAMVSYFAEQSKSVRKRNSPETGVLCLGGERNKSVSEVFKIKDEPPEAYPDLHNVLTNHCVLALDGLVYCLGGAIDGKAFQSTNKAYKLNLSKPNLKWEEIASMTEQRCDFAAAVYDDRLIVSGGNHGFSRLKTTELYDPSSKNWKKIEPMIEPRTGHQLVAADNCLFAIGGSHILGQLSSVEELRGLNGAWQRGKSLNSKRSSFAAVTWKNFIFAIGGYSSSVKALDSVEKYDHNKSEWILVQSMHVGRYQHAACVLKGKIYVVGGKNANDEVVKTIECYNPQTDQWTMVGETEQEYSNHALVAV